MGNENHALKYGLIGGMIIIALSLLMDLTGLVDPAKQQGNWLASIVSIAVFVWALFFAIRSERADLGGVITFGTAFKVAFIAALVIAVLSAIYTYVYATFINPDMIDQIKETMMESLAVQGFSDEQIEQQMELMGKMTSIPMMAIMGFIGNLLVGVIIGLIGAVILKKDSSGTIDA